VRLIDGVSTQYIEAIYKKGIPDGSWKKFKYNVLVEECTYKDGILHGAYIEYYADGSKKLEQYFVNGKAEGKFLYYGSNDKIEREVNYKDGQQDGADISYDRDGNIQSTTFYSAGKEAGLKKQLYSDYELTANYIDGKYDGDYSEIYTNGNVKVTGHYTNGKKDGTWESGKKDGNRIKTEEYANDDKIKETTYYTNNNIEVVRELKNGRKNGWERKYDSKTGALTSELYYLDGAISSIMADSDRDSGNSSGLAKQTRRASVNGQPYIETFYQNNNKYEGEYTAQWAEGDKAMKTKGQYENGKKTGLWEYFDAYGNKQKEENFVNDKLEGKQTIYEGNAVSKYYHYKNDVHDGEFAVYRDKNVLMEKGMYVNNRLEGLQTRYYPNGKLRSETVIPHNPNGERIEKEYSETGVLLIERHYENSWPVSEKQYFGNGKLRLVKQHNENGNYTVVEEYDESGKKIK
jgi:antitoxin component YwqK of YwqJK toxin-antitoxin module